MLISAQTMTDRLVICGRAVGAHSTQFDIPTSYDPSHTRLLVATARCHGPGEALCAQH